MQQAVHPPTQEATALQPWRNAQRVSSEALAKEDMLRRVSPKKPRGTTAVKPWGSTQAATLREEAGA